VSVLVISAAPLAAQEQKASEVRRVVTKIDASGKAVVMLDGAYYVGTGATSAKWRAMQRDAHIGWVIDGGPRSAYKGASLRGHAEEVRDATMRARVYEALGRKYFGTLEQAKCLEIFGRVDDPGTVYLRLVPTDGLTWEYGSN